MYILYFVLLCMRASVWIWHNSCYFLCYVNASFKKQKTRFVIVSFQLTAILYFKQMTYYQQKGIFSVPSNY